MIKRYTAILIILLANTLILAHAVIPHHHHEDKICFTESHCDHEDHDNNKNHEHDHDSDNEHVFCLLKQIVGVPVNHLKQDYKCPGFDLDQLNNNFHIFLTDVNTNDFVQKVFLVSHHPFISSNYSEHLIKSSGLRGPPVV